MAIRLIRQIGQAVRQIGAATTPSDAIQNNEQGQLVMRLDIALADFQDPTKSIYYRFEWLNNGVWTPGPGGTWQGTPTMRNPAYQFGNGEPFSIPADPTNLEIVPAILLDLDTNYQWLRGHDVRAYFEIFAVVTAGLVYESRTAPDKLAQA